MTIQDDRLTEIEFRETLFVFNNEVNKLCVIKL